MSARIAAAIIHHIFGFVATGMVVHAVVRWLDASLDALLYVAIWFVVDIIAWTAEFAHDELKRRGIK